MPSIENIRLAVVDDDPLFLEQLSAVLARECNLRVTQATSGEELMRALDAQSVDCVVLDYDLRGETGLGVGEQVRAKYADPPPIVMLTGTGGERTAVKAFRGGFSDYVSKRNLNSTELVSAIRRAVDQNAQELNAKAEIERLKKQSLYDGMTGLYGPRYVAERLADLTRQGNPFAIVMIRMRELEKIRSQLGQRAGDDALRAFAKRLQALNRKPNICGRHSGDAFICIVDGAASASAVSGLCEKFAEALSFDIDFGEARLRLGAAIGAAIFPENGADASFLLHSAQSALARSESMNEAYTTAFTPPANGSAVRNNGNGTQEKASQSETSPDVTGRTAERRSEPRRRVLKRAQIFQNEISTVIDCTVRNLSPTGAGLRLDGLFIAPDRFELLIQGTPERRSVEKRWQRGNDLGVRFLSGDE